jgi:hypothetical protein
MIVGIPAFGLHDLTRQAAETAYHTAGNVRVVVFDNASPDPFTKDEFAAPVTVIRNRHNEGNWYPLRQMVDRWPDEDIYVLTHNDMVFYEQEWDVRVWDAFSSDSRFGMVGFAGSAVIGENGERGPTASNLRGEKGESAEKAGYRTRDLVPARAIDGLFMAVRNEAISALTLDRTLPPAHWYDYIWSAQIVEAGWLLATLGIDCDHIGWQTEVGMAEALIPEWARWVEEAGVPTRGDPMEAIRAAGWHRWNEFKPRYWPR